MIRPLVALAAFLLLASCKPGSHRAEAAFVGGALAFVDPEGGELRGCWKELKVIGDGQVAWSFTHPGLGECGPVYPLFYGKAPQGATETVPAARLQPGRPYLVAGNLTFALEGAFVLEAGEGRLRVRNVDPESPEARRLRAQKGQIGG